MQAEPHHFARAFTRSLSFEVAQSLSQSIFDINLESFITQQHNVTPLSGYKDARLEFESFIACLCRLVLLILVAPHSNDMPLEKLPSYSSSPQKVTTRRCLDLKVTSPTMRKAQRSSTGSMLSSQPTPGAAPR